jgi:hypothetical protein
MRWLATATLVGLAVLAACSGPSRAPAIDAAIDTPSGACAQCRPDQLCVASYDGVCKSRGVECVTKTVDCPGNVCSMTCQSAYCGAPFQCQNRAPCGGEPPQAFTCYGP